MENTDQNLIICKNVGCFFSDISDIADLENADFGSLVCEFMFSLILKNFCGFRAEFYATYTLASARTTKTIERIIVKINIIFSAPRLVR